MKAVAIAVLILLLGGYCLLLTRHRDFGAGYKPPPYYHPTKKT